MDQKIDKYAKLANFKVFNFSCNWGINWYWKGTKTSPTKRICGIRTFILIALFATISAFISGFADVDAITISMALLAKTTISGEVAVTAITLAAISNTIIKFLLELFFGTGKFGQMVGIIFALIITVGLIAILFVWIILGVE